jgi:hypothetical protein
MESGLNLDIDLLRAKIFYGLKSLQNRDDTLEPRYLEIAVCESFGFIHVGDSSFYADGILNTDQASVKTRALSPHQLKTKENRDFQSHPEKFLGPQVNQKHNRWTNGLEIVQRRQKLNLENDSTADPKIIGQESISGFLLNIDESKKKFNTQNTYEVIVAHGYDRTKNYYILSLFWQEYEPLDFEKINWVREGYGVSGYITVEGISKKICERVDGNAKREATCFKEYKDVTKYKNSANIKIPLPDPWKFDKNSVLEEIYLKEKQNESVLFDRQHQNLQ